MNEIVFFNRHSGRMETEKIYGDRSLRWVYGSVLGRIALHALVKRALFSAWYGRRMDAPASREKIRPFIREFGISESEMAEPVESFRCFNEFFFRRLKPEARPVDDDDNALVFPADGRHLLIEDIDTAEDFWVKGARFDLKRFVGDAALAERYAGGSLLISRLAPVDYHRFHFPCGGSVSAPKLLNGWLYSVSPVALRQRPSILWENKRCLTEIDSGADGFGRVLFVEIGATCVGGIVHTVGGGERVTKGDEKGYFRFGGSSVATILEKGRVQWADDLREHGACGVEVYAKMGARAGTRL